MFEWEEPYANNSNIHGYTVILDGKVLAQGIEELYYEIHELNPNTCYRVQIVAESDIGEGYKAKQPHIF